MLVQIQPAPPVSEKHVILALVNNSKTCYKCDTTKVLTDFHRRSKAKDGRQGMCKRCNSNWVRGRYAKNKASHYLSVRKSRDRRRIYLQDLSIGIRAKSGCVDCGFSDPRALQFDHIDRANKYMAVCQLIANGVSEQRILDEIAKCEVRCANCHAVKTAQQCNHRSNDARWQSGNASDC